MCFRTLATALLLGVSVLWAADDPRLALALRAQTDFDRVEAPAAPSLADSEQCVQSEAALLVVAPPEEVGLVHYRKGYCTLTGALITRNAGEFAQAGREFDQSLESWAARPRITGKNAPPENRSAGVRVLASIARLKAGLDQSGIDRERVGLAQALENSSCPASVMPVNLCRQVVEDGRRWLGWIAFERDNLPEAAKDLSGPGAEGWSAWVAGRSAAQLNRYTDAAAEYRKALELWTAKPSQPPSLAERLMPQPALAPDYEDLGGAEILAGDPVAAIASLDAAVKLNPLNAHAIYLRARAKEMAGRSEQALADYNMASRTAFANAKDLASGEAHLYRGILLYRRQDYARAEDEFASALNFDVPAALRADAAAWRHLAAVASGACGSRGNLDRAMIPASPYFPRDEARTAMNSCPATVTSAGAAQNPGQ
jgi:tetratricopeptide (TPR) repeat protein